LRARSRATWRIRRAVEPIRTIPAASAMIQPVVPAWVAVTLIVTGRPTGLPETVVSWATTRTVPLALASTCAVPE
jgi:hypothetical protein